MKQTRDAEAETRLLVQLVAKVKSLNLLVAQEHGVLDLKSPAAR
jgi:hypothetical protein